MSVASALIGEPGVRLPDIGTFSSAAARRGPSMILPMKKAILFAAVLAGLGVLASRFVPKLRDIDWEKRFEAMPDDAPPKWIFRNITAIRENTDKILKLLEPGRAEPARQDAPPAGD